MTAREPGTADGVIGSIASGAPFDNMRVVSGRMRHNATFGLHRPDRLTP